LLEVGCGYGYLLEEGIGYFNPRIGTEFSPQAVKEAQRRADYIFEGGIEQIPPDERFDCIIANQVIEHVYEPQRFLEQLIAHLRPGGRVVIATPDMGSFWRRLMGHHWPSFKIPEHIIFFDKKSLYTLMRQAGLIKISILPYPHAFPLSLIASKLHTPLTSRLGKINLWIPATTIAMYGIVPDG
jgi:SAM-dependent methyltransferase